MKQVFSFLMALPLIFSFNLFSRFSWQEERWNWDKIPCESIEFPKNFLWGTSSSALQTEGLITSNNQEVRNCWTEWQEEEIILNGVKQTRIPIADRMGKACEHWDRYPEDLKLAANIGIKAHRFSIEWSKIEPQKGVFDHEAMQHYIDYVWEMVKNDIIPIPTLFHHTWPLWFEYKEDESRGFAFEDSQNIQDFVEYALFVFNAFKEAGLDEHIRLWITINEPVGVALAGYLSPLLPPGKKFKFKLAGIVAKNMLDTHIAVYDAFKALDATIKIGFTHIMQPIQPYHPWNPLDQIPAKIFNYLLNDTALHYFKSGHFNWLWILKDHNLNAINKADFIGVNYYTHTLLKMFKETTRPHEILSDTINGVEGKAMYPEGFYLSIKKASMLNIPIIISENGFATDDTQLREEYIKQHLYVIYKAMNEGIDIRGYLFWTLTDCYGWRSFFNCKHGLYKVDFETQERTLKDSARYLVHVMQHKSSFTNSIEPLATRSDVSICNL